jgi:hypothetical protein
MTISHDVMTDLLTVYLAGDASADTKALIEEYARSNQAFADRLRAAATISVPADPVEESLPPDRHLRALERTREFIFLRTLFTAGAVLFTLLPLVFTFGPGGVEFLILGRHPGLVWSFWSLAVAAWAACYVMHRQIRLSGV